MKIYLARQWIVCVALLWAVAGSAAAADRPLLHASYGGVAGYQLPLWVIKEAEISQKYGFDIEPLLISGGALGMQALLAGSTQMSQNSASAAIQRSTARRTHHHNCDAGKSHAVAGGVTPGNKKPRTADR